MAGWRRSADRAFLQVNSLLLGNLTGNFAFSGIQETFPGAKATVPQALFEQFPMLANRENYSRIREISRRNRERGANNCDLLSIVSRRSRRR
jgi:hypothetical protein